VQNAVDRARRYLLLRQQADGHWVGELQGDTILESEYIMLLAFLGRERDERVTRAARYLLRQQMPEGGWNNYPDGPVELSVSVKAYFALKLAGHDPEAPYMRRACAAIRTLGGAARCNSFTKFYLALLGQLPYDNCPAVPPEMLLLPRWAYFNIYAMSSWTRTIVVPLSIFYAHKPVRRLPPELGIAELFLQPPETSLWPSKPTRRLLTWPNFFLAVDWVIKRLEKGPFGRLRSAALKRAEDWLLEHCADSDGVGAIFPPMIYTVICLRCLGYADDSPAMQWALEQLDNLMIPEGDTLRLQPCFSPVWDTALTLNALADAGLSARHPAILRAVKWLLAKEVRRPGDWSIRHPDLEPGGWFFEYRNGFYPDTDDTAMVLMALARTGHAYVQTEEPGTRIEDRGPPKPAVRRAVNWLLAMQNRDGGWAAFDRGITRQVLTQVPFADHNAMLDPSCPDITARVLEALGALGYQAGNAQVDRALTFLQATQDPEGCWLGRWGVNYIYGTWQVLVGLRAIGFDMAHPMVRRAAAWLKQVQQPGGGWGETCRSYDDPALKGQGTPTASQTAWALLGLMAAGESRSPEVRAGIDYLLATQSHDGDWREEEFTGTGFPKVFYLKYHMYALYFPLMALARYAKTLKNEQPRHREDKKEALLHTGKRK
jgi:squalene-hopene/tetraprenyl-beta-curcumene cyclase